MNNILLLNLKIYFEVYKCTEIISNFIFCFVWFSFSLIFLNFLSDPKRDIYPLHFPLFLQRIVSISASSCVFIHRLTQKAAVNAVCH